MLARRGRTNMSSKAVDRYRQYVEAWAAISDQERRAILNSVLATDIHYRIPRMEGTGHSIVIENMNGVQERWPGGKLALRSVSEHHDVALMEWQLILPDGTPAVVGHDFIAITSEGKVGQIITFAPSTPE